MTSPSQGAAGSVISGFDTAVKREYISRMTMGLPAVTLILSSAFSTQSNQLHSLAWRTGCVYGQPRTNLVAVV